MTEAEFVRLEERLQNWGLWASTDGRAQGHCASVEHRYVGEKLGDGEQAVHRTPRAIDVADAEVVEDAVTTLFCPRARLFFKEAFVRRLCRDALERRFGIKGDLYLGFRRRVASLLQENLGVRYRRAYPSDLKRLRYGVARIAKAGV